MPGPWSPIELSIPCSVSAIRTGGLPSRGSGVIVFVTNPSSDRATSGAASASRQPEALRSRTRHARAQYRALEAEADVAAVARDDAAVAGAVAAGHRRLAGELRARHEALERVEHRLRAAGEDVARLGGQRLGDERRVEHDLRVRDERRGLGVVRGAEPEQRRRRAEPLREVRQRRDPDAAADEERPLDGEVVSLPERPRHGDPVAGARAPRSHACRADRVDEEAELPGGREAEAERAREQPTRRLEHEELPGLARLEPAASETHERVRPDRLVRHHAEPLTPHRSAPCVESHKRCREPPTAGSCTPELGELVVIHHKRRHAPTPIRSWRESVASARAFAIACTAAAAPEIVVMHGTRATSAASRIR